MIGPHTIGGKDILPGPLAPVGRLLAQALGRVPVPPLPAVAPAHPVQLVHEEDVGRALVRCVVGGGPPGAYNIAADDLLTVAQIARELGLLAISAPAGPAQAAARLVARLPLPPTLEWIEAASHPAVMDTTKARQELGWAPRWTARRALRDTIRRGP